MRINKIWINKRKINQCREIINNYNKLNKIKDKIIFYKRKMKKQNKNK